MWTLKMQQGGSLLDFWILAAATLGKASCLLYSRNLCSGKGVLDWTRRHPCCAHGTGALGRAHA